MSQLHLTAWEERSYSPFFSGVDSYRCIFHQEKKMDQVRVLQSAYLNSDSKLSALSWDDGVLTFVNLCTFVSAPKAPTPPRPFASSAVHASLQALLPPRWVPSPAPVFASVTYLAPAAEFLALPRLPDEGTGAAHVRNDRQGHAQGGLCQGTLRRGPRRQALLGGR